MSLKQFSRTKLSVSIGLIIGSLMTSSAQGADEVEGNERKIETILVTAQKRIQSTQEVPISISTVGEEELKNAGVNSISDIQVLVPSLNVYTGNVPTMSSITLRGAGTGASDPTLQPSVGVFIDGVYMPRSVFGISDLVDIDRVEVLLGPQGTLYGKNTNSGVISVSTKGAPDDFEFQGQIDVGNYDKTDGQFSFGYGLTDDFSFRLAGLVRKQDGFIDNLATGETLGDVDKQAFRGQFYWDPTESLSLRAIAYTSTSKGARNISELNFEPSVYSEALIPLYASFFGKTADEVVDKDPLNRKVFKNMGNGLEPEVKAEGGSFHLDWDLGGVSVTSISAYQKWSQVDYINDGDGTALDITTSTDDMSEKSFSQELRISSYGNETFDWVTGLFYFDSKLIRGSEDPSRPYSTYALGLPGILTADTPFASLAGFFPNLISGGDNATWYNKYETDSIAVFGQVNWHLSDDTELTLGLRYGKENTDFKMSSSSYDGQGRELNLLNLLTGNYSGGAFIPYVGGMVGEIMPEFMKYMANPADPSINWAAGPIARSDVRDDSDVTGMISLTHQLDRDTMVFATVATGAKSGGFNGSFGSLTADAREFEQENTTNYEIGVKMDLLDGNMRLNTSYFHTVYDDFQAASFDPQTVSFVVINAGKQTTKGVDVDLIYLVTDNLTFNAKVEYLNAEYNDFKNAQCHKFAEAERDAFGTCTLDGQTLEFAPKWAGSVSFDYIKEINDGEFYANINNSFKTDHFTDPTRAPYSETSYSLVNARIGWRTEAWDISLWGKNLTDEIYGRGYTGNFISNSLGDAGNANDYNVFLNDPSTYGVTVRYSL